MVKSVMGKKAIKGTKFSGRDDFFCESCQLDKAHNLEFKKSEKQSWKPGEHIDTVCADLEKINWWLSVLFAVRR